MCLAKITKSVSILCRINVEMPVDLHQGQASFVVVDFLQQQLIFVAIAIFENSG
jgi:hypothetical protein